MSAALSEAEELEYLALMEAQYGGEDLADFIRRVMPSLPPPAHVAPLRKLIERTRHEEVRAVVSMPPRHCKTLTLLPGLAWRVQRDPACLNAYLSYGDDFARIGSKKVRNLALIAGVELSVDTTAANDWRTPYGGGLIAAGAQGQIIGKGITGLLVLDDPHKGRIEAESQQARDNVWTCFGDAYTRLEPGASAIVCHTRWHGDDTIGRLRSGELGDAWEVLELPAVKGDDEDERALWDEVYPLEWLRKVRTTLGEYRWWSEYQQNPRPRGDVLFGDPPRFDLAKFDPTGCRFVNAVDPAASEKTHADWSVCVTAAVKGYGAQAQIYILDVQRWQVQVPKLVEELLSVQTKSRWGRSAPMLVEAVGGFKAIPQMLRAAAPELRLTEITPKGDKFTRAQPTAAAWRSGLILVPQQAPWLAKYLQEMQAFTGISDPHDDQVDATVHAVDYLRAGLDAAAQFRALASL